MNTTSIIIRTDPQVKKDAQKTAKEMGLSLNAIVTGLLKEFVKRKTITFTNEELTPYAKAQLKKATENRVQGKGSRLFTDKDELIKKDPKKYRHIDTMQEWFREQGV
jgi:antitoxin component of RelBE/YafQ-DinJ toxin-antitoxin module